MTRCVRPAAAGGSFMASLFPSSPLGHVSLFQTCSSQQGLGRVIPPCHITGCCSCYSFYFYLPTYFDEEGNFILIAVPQSHGQKKKYCEFQSRTTTFEVLLYSLEAAPPMALMTIPPLWLRSKGRRRQSGSFTRWAFLSFPNTGEDNHS